MIELKKAVDAIIKKDFKTALENLLPIAKDGNASAQFYLGSFYFFGLGVIENQKEGDRLRSSAIKLFKEQSQNGNKEAILKLSRILAHGIQLDNTNFQEELKLLKQASSYGCREASFLLGNIYNTGNKINDTKILGNLYNTSSKSNDINHDNVFPIINEKEAFKWFKISAEQGMIFGMINVANFLKQGTGVKQNYRDAFKWYNIAILSYKKIVNYKHADTWEYMVIPSNNRHIKDIKKSLKSTEIFEIVKIANEYVREKIKEGVLDYSNKDELDVFLEFIDNLELSNT